MCACGEDTCPACSWRSDRNNYLLRQLRNRYKRPDEPSPEDMAYVYQSLGVTNPEEGNA